MQIGQDPLLIPVGQMDHLGEACPPNPTMEIAQSLSFFVSVTMHACIYQNISNGTQKLIPKLFKDSEISPLKFFVIF